MTHESQKTPHPNLRSRLSFQFFLESFEYQRASTSVGKLYPRFFESVPFISFGLHLTTVDLLVYNPAYQTTDMVSRENINWAIYNSLPPEEAQYQLAHIHESKIASVAITYAICLPILVLSIVMRFVSRRIGRTKYGSDDWVMLLGVVIILFAGPLYTHRRQCTNQSGDRFWQFQT